MATRSGVVEPHRLAVVLSASGGTPAASARVACRDANSPIFAARRRRIAGFGRVAGNVSSPATDGLRPGIVGLRMRRRYRCSACRRPPAGPSRGGRPAAASGSPVAIVGDRLARGAFGGPSLAVGPTITSTAGRSQSSASCRRAFVGALAVQPRGRLGIRAPRITCNHFAEADHARDAGRGRPSLLYVRRATGAGRPSKALQAELDVLVPALAEQHPDDNKEFRQRGLGCFRGSAPTRCSARQIRGLVRNLLMVGGALLLLGCANVANLLSPRRPAQPRARRAPGARREPRPARPAAPHRELLARARGRAVGVGLALWLKQLIVQTLLLPGVANAAGLELTCRSTFACSLVDARPVRRVRSHRPAWRRLSIGIPTRRTVSRRGRDATGRSWVRPAWPSAQLALSLALLTERDCSSSRCETSARPTSVSSPRGEHPLPRPRQPRLLEDRAMAFSRDLVWPPAADPAFRGSSLSTGIPAELRLRHARAGCGGRQEDHGHLRELRDGRLLRAMGQTVLLDGCSAPPRR